MICLVHGLHWKASWSAWLLLNRQYIHMLYWEMSISFQRWLHYIIILPKDIMYCFSQFQNLKCFERDLNSCLELLGNHKSRKEKGNEQQQWQKPLFFLNTGASELFPLRIICCCGFLGWCLLSYFPQQSPKKIGPRLEIGSKSKNV